jgi:hypothetical protein
VHSAVKKQDTAHNVQLPASASSSIEDEIAQVLTQNHAHSPVVSAALMLEKGIDRGPYAVGLTRDEKTAVLGVLDNPPAGIAELRGVLMRDATG